ncbi:MAG: hypothetical protein NWR72_14230 [Bacteroidia bacterium]|nr:hypothetical protein [Bacteroidia bacterium]
MYRIRKSVEGWFIRNTITGTVKELNEAEIESLLNEFPHLRDSTTVTYFRNQVKSIPDLP